MQLPALPGISVLVRYLHESVRGPIPARQSPPTPCPPLSNPSPNIPPPSILHSVHPFLPSSSAACLMSPRLMREPSTSACQEPTGVVKKPPDLGLTPLSMVHAVLNGPESKTPSFFLDSFGLFITRAARPTVSHASLPADRGPSPAMRGTR